MLRSWLKFIATTSASRTETSSVQGERSPVSFLNNSRVGSLESLSQSFPILDSSSQLGDLLQSPSNPDTISIGSQSSVGFFMPMSQSPLPQSPLGRSPDSDSVISGGSRPHTPLSFPLVTEESADRPKGLRSRSPSVTSFFKLFPSSQTGAKTGQLELKEKACDYCLRLLEQSERSKYEECWVKWNSDSCLIHRNLIHQCNIVWKNSAV